MTELVLPPSGLAEDLLQEFGIAAEPPPVAPPPVETWVTFDVAGETYALPVGSVLEILRVAGITRVPHAPAVVRGVTNMRGRVLPVIDLRVRLGIAATDAGPQSRILVASSRGRLLGLLVDAVRHVERIDRGSVQPPPADVMTPQSDYITGVCHIGERLIVLLDADLVLVIAGSEKRHEMVL